MNISYMSDHCLKIVIAVSLIFILKAVIGVVSSLLIKTPLRTSIHAGIGLAQVGEFSFVLAVAGRSAGIITEEFYQIFLSSSVVTMMMTPFMMMIAPVVSRSVTSSHVIKKLIKLQRVSEGEGLPRKREGHVIIIGFGLNGRHLARVLKEADIPYVVLEMNIDTVIDMKKKREPIYYGDGTSKEILNKLSIQNARLLVVAISDPASTRRTRPSPTQRPRAVRLGSSALRSSRASRKRLCCNSPATFERSIAPRRGTY